MVLDVAGAFRSGVDKLVSRNGIVLTAALILNNILFITLPTELLQPGRLTSDLFATALVELIGLVISMAIIVVAIRTFIADRRDSIAEEDIHHRLGGATLHLTIGHLVAIIIVAAGFILIVPGFYLLVSLLFWHIIVVMEDEDFVDGFRESWRFVRGHRWKLFGLVLGLIGIVILLQLIGTGTARVADSSVFESLVFDALYAVGVVYSLGVVTDAYNQIRGEPDL